MLKKRWLYLGITIEIFHLTFLIAVLICGRIWLPNDIVTLIIIVTVTSQVILLDCLISILSDYCFHRYNPDWIIPSVARWLYRKYGRVTGILVFPVLMITSRIGPALF